MRSGLLFASVVAAVTLLPSSGWATTAKDCPTEPKQGVGIGSGQTYYGGHCVLNTASEIDGFQFTASAGDTWSVVLGLGPSPPTDICVTVYGPGNPPPVILPKSCTFAHNLVYAVAANLPLTASGTYTIDVTEENTAAVSYGLSLERLSPIPSDAVGLTLGQAINGGTVAPTAQNAFTFYGGTTGTYEILASVVSGSAYNVCFAVYQPGGTSALSGNPFCTFVHNGVVSTQTNLTPSKNGTYLVVVYTGPRADELVGPNDGTVNYSLSVTCLTTCPNAPPPPCVLTDTPSYDAATGKLTMDFTIATEVAATWNGWLTSENTMQQLWSLSQPKTEPVVSVTKTQTGVAKSGKIGILSTLTTATGGITCASWQTVNTGTP